MFVKITSDNIKNLKKGDIVIKYPVIGNPVDEVDENDSKQLNVMLIDIIRYDSIDLLLQSSFQNIGMMQVSIGALHKNKIEMINENKWWLYEKEISN